MRNTALVGMALWAVVLAGPFAFGQSQYPGGWEVKGRVIEHLTIPGRNRPNQKGAYGLPMQLYGQEANGAMPVQLNSATLFKDVVVNKTWKEELKKGAQVIVGGNIYRGRLREDKTRELDEIKAELILVDAEAVTWAPPLLLSVSGYFDITDRNVPRLPRIFGGTVASEDPLQVEFKVKKMGENPAQEAKAAGHSLKDETVLVKLVFGLPCHVLKREKTGGGEAKLDTWWYLKGTRHTYTEQRQEARRSSDQDRDRRTNLTKSYFTAQSGLRFLALPENSVYYLMLRTGKEQQ